MSPWFQPCDSARGHVHSVSKHHRLDLLGSVVLADRRLDLLGSVVFADRRLDLLGSDVVAHQLEWLVLRQIQLAQPPPQQSLDVLVQEGVDGQNPFAVG